jgi:hypothetical protein
MATKKSQPIAFSDVLGTRIFMGMSTVEGRGFGVTIQQHMGRACCQTSSLTRAARR